MDQLDFDNIAESTRLLRAIEEGYWLTVVGKRVVRPKDTDIEKLPTVQPSQVELGRDVVGNYVVIGSTVVVWDHNRQPWLHVASSGLRSYVTGAGFTPISRERRWACEVLLDKLAADLSAYDQSAWRMLFARGLGDPPDKFAEACGFDQPDFDVNIGSAQKPTTEWVAVPEPARLYCDPGDYLAQQDAADEPLDARRWDFAALFPARSPSGSESPDAATPGDSGLIPFLSLSEPFSLGPDY